MVQPGQAYRVGRALTIFDVVTKRAIFSLLRVKLAYRIPLAKPWTAIFGARSSTVRGPYRRLSLAPYGGDRIALMIAPDYPGQKPRRNSAYFHAQNLPDLRVVKTDRFWRRNTHEHLLISRLRSLRFLQKMHIYATTSSGRKNCGRWFLSYTAIQTTIL